MAADDRFCEQCGARLIDEEEVPSGCRVCGAPVDAIDGDGYCSVCGARERSSADRIELDLVVAAAVSDRGRVHRRNEDAFHVEVLDNNGVAAVVCDGISSASAGDVAAVRAAETAGAMLAKAASEPSRDVAAATAEAIQAANGAVELVPWTTRTERVDPSCTLVSAVCRDGEVVIGWVGDSRAYWVDPDGPRQLTVDDSWAEESVAEGLITPEQAARSPFLHSITNWVGPDAPARPPQVLTVRPDHAGTLVLCTDGLWNYMATPSELGELIEGLPAGAAPAAIARALADVALERGGRDNITVAVVHVDPSTRSVT
jgi:serine/threonine protein phosphatase PrpC